MDDEHQGEVGGGGGAFEDVPEESDAILHGQQVALAGGQRGEEVARTLAGAVPVVDQDVLCGHGLSAACQAAAP